MKVFGFEGSKQLVPQNNKVTDTVLGKNEK